MRCPLIHLGLLVLSSLPAWAAEPVPITDPQDVKIRDAFLEHTRNELAGLTKEHFASVQVPETLCWVDSPKLGMALTAYQLTGDRQYLKGFVAAVEDMRSAVVKGPDGYPGWYGQPEKSLLDPARPDAVVSEIQTDFRVTATLARFAEIVDADPALKEEFGAHREEYIAFAQDHLVKKWDVSFVDLGDRGGVYRWNANYKPLVAAMSLPQEKLAIMIDGLVRLYVVTGDPQYAEKAAKLGLWFKRCLEFDGQRYAWNRWNPAGKWDVSLDNPAKWRSWVAKEPKGQWHAASVGSAVQLYDCGLVFDREDIERFLRTQTKVCWNGDIQNPAFFQVNGTPAKDGERYIAPSLAPFDAKYASLLYEGPAQAYRVEKSGSPWQGGVLASDWLLGKYVILKAGPSPAHADKGRAFLAKADPALLKRLAFKPEPPGFITPPVPAEAVLASMPQ